MTSEIDNITQQRTEKMQHFRDRGIDPYPHRYHRTHTISQAIAVLAQQESNTEMKSDSMSVAGRIMSNRNMGKSTFMDIKDDSGKMQLYLKRDTLGEETYGCLKDLDIGDIIGVNGEVFRTHSGEPTLRVSGYTLLSKSLRPLPEKWHGLVDVEKRYRQRYLDLISNDEIKNIFRTRSKIISVLRCFMDNKGFLEVETPVLQPSAGGAMAKPFITHHNSLNRDFYLRIATELYLKRIIIGGFDKVYEIGRIFRNEGIDFKHNPEFTMMEVYEAYSDYEKMMDLVEQMVLYICQETTGGTTVNYGDDLIDFTPPWARLYLREEILKYSGIDFNEYPDAASLRKQMGTLGIPVDTSKGRGKLIDELTSKFVEPHLIKPTFLLDYPIELSPLAKRKPGNDQLVERFEAFAGGMEIANSFTELNDPLDQRARFLQQQKAREMGDEEAELPDEDFLIAMEHGMPPTGGLGVGIDRLVMLITNQHSLREIILFPQLKTQE